MKHTTTLILLLCVTIISSCTHKMETHSSKSQLITTFATPETQALYQTLFDLQGKTTLIGQQDAMTLSRIDRSNEPFGDCDIYYGVGDYPAIFGFDVAWGCHKLIPEIMAAVKLGGIITLVCHYPNPDAPETEVNSYRTQYGNDVKKILPGGENHQWLIERLDSVADLASKIVYDGKKVPIIFRPWHEHTGGWFWWGTKASTEDEFIDLWRFTIEYLRDEKRVDNLIYAFSPSLNIGQTDYHDRNPGAEYMDIAGFDCYSFDGKEHEEHFTQACEIAVQYAAQHSKIAACTEFGFQGGMKNSKNPNWFTDGVLNPIKATSTARKISYALVWHNNGEEWWWAPIPGDQTFDSFKQLYDDPYTSFLKEWTNLKN